MSGNPVTSATPSGRHLLIWLTLILLGALSAQAQESARLALLISNQAYAAKVGPLASDRGGQPQNQPLVGLQPIRSQHVTDLGEACR
jgi:hypothetical protein